MRAIFFLNFFASFCSSLVFGRRSIFISIKKIITRILSIENNVHRSNIGGNLFSSKRRK